MELFSVPVNSASDNLGTLVVGKRFAAASYHQQAVLMEGGKAVAKAGLALSTQQATAAFADCAC